MELVEVVVVYRGLERQHPLLPTEEKVAVAVVERRMEQIGLMRHQILLSLVMMVMLPEGALIPLIIIIQQVLRGQIQSF